MWRKQPAAVRMHWQRRRSTNRTSRVDQDMGIRLAGDIQVRIKPVAHTGQHDDPRSAGDSIVEELAVIAQPQLEDVERVSPHVLEKEIPQEVIDEITRPHQPEGMSPQQPVEKGYKEETETLNVLVNDG